MNWFELSLLALAVSMDAFAVAITVGLTMAKVSVKKALIVGAYFGGFQAGMPLIGYIVAIRFSERLLSFNHWIVFGLLAFLGIRMVIGSFKKEKCPDRECSPTVCSDRKCPAGKQEASLKPSKMIPLALATSVDAMAVGVSLAFMQVNIALAVSFIGISTLVISMIGVKIGNVFGTRFQSKATLIGGIILIVMGVNVLFEHLGFISF
jgi:putative Mn2+ efflux pump MntP